MRESTQKVIQFVAAKVEVRYLNRGGRDGWGYVPWCVTHTAPTTTSRSVVTPADLGIDLPNDQVVPDVAASIVASEDALPSYDDLFAPAGAEAVNSPTGEVFFLGHGWVGGKKGGQAHVLVLWTECS